jgi:hypothetical protein
MFKKLLLGAAVTLLTFSMSIAPASATFAGQNGKILYSKGDNKLYLANPDGGNETVINGPSDLTNGRLSPDGQMIAHSGRWPDNPAPNVSIATIDGTPLSKYGYFVGEPSWTPDGLSYYFESCYDQCYLFKQNIDGSDTKNVLNVGYGTVSPDGNKYAKVEHSQTPSKILSTAGLLAMNTSRTPLQTVYSENAYDSLWCTSWSPDSTKIATWSSEGTTYSQKKLKIIDAANGTVVKQFLFNGFPYCPVWSPDSTTVIFGADKDTRLDLLGEYTDNALIKINLLTGNEQRVKDGYHYVYDWQSISNPMLYRLANWKTHERLFTTNKNEVFAAQNNDSGWVYEGVAMRVYDQSATGQSTVYRMANWKSKERLFTTSFDEVTAIKDKNGWVYEGVAFYGSASGTPVYRMANWMTSERLFTTDLNEVNHIKDKNGWVYEGVAYYAPQ